MVLDEFDNEELIRTLNKRGISDVLGGASDEQILQEVKIRNLDNKFEYEEILDDLYELKNIKETLSSDFFKRKLQDIFDTYL